MPNRMIIAEEDGERIDALLARSLTELSRSAVVRLIEQGLVTCRGVEVKKNARARRGEAFSVCIPEPEPAQPEPEDIPLSVVYEDDDLIVVDKPRGMVVHPAPGHADGTLVNALLHHCGGSLSGVGGERRPGIVHRIDKDTSGLIIAAKNDFAHTRLSAQLSDHSLYRVYTAVVVGRVRDDQGVIDAPIGRCPSDRKRMAVTNVNSRAAVTRYRVLARYNGYTLITCRLETGRTHQIRVHMAHIGHPVLGDPLYCRIKTSVRAEGGQCLHATELHFKHPRTGEELRLSSPLPEYFTDTVRKLGEEIP